MAALLAGLSARYGSVAGYLESAGVSAAVLMQLRENVLA